MENKINTAEQNTSVQASGDYFGLHQRNTNVKREMMAGLVIFMSMFYIVAVQMAFFGGTDGISAGTFGIITALSAGLISILMGVWANHPAALAPGMGVNAFVAFTLLIGTDPISLEAALSAVLISGLLFILISVTPVRGKIMDSIPEDLRKAIAIGVGLFLMFVALTDGEVIMNFSDDPFLGTPTALGPLNDPFVLLSVFGIVLTLVLYVLEVPAGVLIAMGVTAAVGVVIGWTGWEVTVTSSGAPLSLPQLTFDGSEYAKSFTDLPQLVGAAFTGLGKASETWANPTWYMAIFTLFLMDFFDTAGTIFGLNSAMEDVEISEQTTRRVLIVDAIGTTTGAVLGTTNVTTFAESATGIQAGGRTGLTSITTGALFLLSIPIIPLLAPLFTYSVTAGPVVLIGIAMASNFKGFNTEDKVVLTSSIMLIMFMILGYSIGLGIVVGLLVYILLMTITGRFSEMDWALVATSPLFLAFLILPLL